MRLTDGVYSDRLMLTRSSSHQHWKNSLSEVNQDVAYVKSLLQKHGDGGGKFSPFPGESPLVNGPRIEHAPITAALAGVDLKIRAKVSGHDSLHRVVLHYRPVNQAVAWKELDLRPAGSGLFEAAIPGSEITTQWDLTYYLEALVKDGGALWPSWEEGQPYVVVTPNRAGQAGVTGRPRNSRPKD